MQAHYCPAVNPLSLCKHATSLRDACPPRARTLRALHRSVAVQHKSIGAIADDNLYALQYITCDAARATAAEAVDTDGGADESMDDGGAHPASEDSKEEWAEGGGGVWNDSGDDDSSD